MGVIQRSISKLKAGRVPQFAAAYGAGALVTLEVFDQLIQNQVLPQVVYQVALALVVTLAPGVLVVSWFHGEKGDQKAPLIEKWLLAGVAVLALGSATVVYRATAPVAVACPQVGNHFLC